MADIPVKVLDSWAIMAWLTEEESAQVVEDEIAACQKGAQDLFLSTINAGEIYYVLAKRHSREKAIEWRDIMLPSLPIRVDLPTTKDIYAAAHLKSLYPISYADAFAVIIALRKSALLITGDREMRFVENLKLQWIGS